MNSHARLLRVTSHHTRPLFTSSVTVFFFIHSIDSCSNKKYNKKLACVTHKKLRFEMERKKNFVRVRKNTRK